MIIPPPKTIEDFTKIRETINQLLLNPFADKGMKQSLNKKLTAVEKKIKTLQESQQKSKS